MIERIDEALKIIEDAGLTPVRISMTYSTSKKLFGSDHKYKGLSIMINNSCPPDHFYIQVEYKP